MRDPSSGGIGMRLKSARMTLIQMRADRTSNVSGPPGRSGTLRSAPTTKASVTFASGPASATCSIPRRGLAKWRGLTGTGRAQPNLNTTKNSVPSRSRWTSGLRLSRPSARGVGSPSRSATKAWANSWKVAATSTAASVIAIPSGSPNPGTDAGRGGLRGERPVVRQQVVDRLAGDDDAGPPVAHEDDRRARVPVVVAGHRVIVGARAEHREEVAGARPRQVRLPNQHVAGLAAPARHGHLLGRRLPEAVRQHRLIS